MLEIKPFDAWAEANATTDPSEKLRQYADYVRTNAYKNGQLDDATNQEIEQGIVDRARVDGLISDEEPEEARNQKLQGLLTPIQNKDADAKFLLDHYRNDFAENSPEFLEKAPTIQQYLSLKQVSPDKVGELQGLVDGYIESKSDVKNARLSAVDRGDYRVVAVEEEGGRQLYTGADTKPDNLNGELDTLISNGAISATDLNDVRKLTMPINGGQATVAEGTRYNVFANTINSLSKKDPTLRSSIDQEAAKLRESKRTEQLTTGETVFDYVKKAVAVPLDFVGGLVTEAFGLSHPEEPVAPPSELIGGNKAITDRFSSGEVNQFLGDYMKRASGPFYRADKPETGLDTDSLGNVIVSPALIGNKAQFEQALKSAPLNDDQKERATIQRMAMLETEAPKILNLILGESNEAVSAYAVARAAGKAPSEFIEEWVGNNSQNYDGMSERLQQLGMSTFSAIATLPVGIGALMGIEPAAKALVAMNKEQSDREEYSRLFGDEFGLTFQLVNTIPQVATDIFATIGTGALYTGAKAIAKGGSKAIMREATRAAVSSVDDVAAASVRSASAVGGEALVGEALEKVGGSLATNLAKADKLVPLFATSFTRSAASTYGSIYGQLPDSMSADEKHHNAFGYAVASGISTAVITSGMSFLGQGGLEDLATGKFRPITAVDDSVTGMRKVSLNELTYKQAKFLNDNLTNSGAKLTDKAFQKALTANIGGAYKNYIRTTLRGAIDEGFEESLDQAIQNRIEDAATDKNTPLADRVNQIWTAFTLGGILGGASPAVGQLVKPLSISDVSLALDARVSVLSKVANDLRKTGSTATAEVLQRQLNDAQAAANTQRQTEIAAQQQKEVQAKTEEVIVQADKPLTFEPTGQAELALGDTRSNTLPQTTRFLTDFDGERAYLGSYAGTLETNGDAVRLILDEPRADGVSHLVVGNRFQPIDKSGIRLDRKRLMLTGEHNLNIPAGTPYVIPDPRKKFKFALPSDAANVSFVQGMADAPALRIENARVIGQENVSSPIILTDKGQIEDALRYYNLDPAVLMQPENVGQLELDLLEDTPAVEVATTPVANPAAVVETPVVKKSRKKKGAASTVVEEPPVVVDPTTIDPAEVIADAIETGDTPPPKAYSEEQEYIRDIVMDNQLTAALLSVKANGFTPEEINSVANGFAPEVFIDLKSRIDKATEYAIGLNDSLADVRSNILSNLTNLAAIYNRVDVAKFIEAKPAVVVEAAPIVEEAPAPVVAPIAETPTTKKTTTKKQSVTPLPDTTVVSNEENPSEGAIDLKEELADLNTTVPVFDVDGELTTLESLEVQFQQLDNRIGVAKANGSSIPSGVLDAYKSLKRTVNVARFAVEGKATEIKAKIEELTAPDPEVDIRTDAQKNADELLSIMKGEKQVSPEVAAAAAAVKPTPSKFKEAKGVGPVGFKGEAQPIVVFRDGVFRNAEEANIYANWVAGGFPISNLAEHGFDPKQVSGINFQSHSTEIKQRLWKDIQERFPFIPVPTGTPTTKSKRRVSYMTKAGDNYIDIPYEADSNGKPVRGVFTNNPLVTAQQIDLGLMIIIPKSVATSAGFSRNLSIDVKDTSKGSFVVTSVKRHPFDTGVFVAGDISLVGKSGTVPKKALTNLGGILRPPAPQFLEGAGPSARNKDNNTFETYMNDMMSVSRGDVLRKDGTSRRSSFGAFDNLITKVFGLTEEGGFNAMSVAQVSYANNIKEYALAKKIQSALAKAQLKKPNTTVIDLNLSRIILEEMVSQGQNAPKPNDVADTIKKVYGLSGGSADGIISNYGQYLYDNITSGEFSLGVKPFRTHVRKAAKSQQVRESRRGDKSRGSSATTQLEYERTLDSLVDVNTDVFEDVARSVDASTLRQLANTLRVNTKAYDSLFKIVQKSYLDISEDMDEEELIDTAGEILRNYTKEEHVILARDLNRSVDGINLANALLDVGWLPPVGSEIITPRQTEGTTAQVEPLPQRATPAQKRQRILDAKALARATIGVQFSQADGRMLADEARKVNNAEIKRLGIVSNDPESVIAALRDLQESGTPMQRLVAGVLTANVDLIRNVRFAIGDMNDVRFAGAFMPKSNLVVINISGHNGRGIVDVLLHEYLHAVTVQTMTNPKTPAQVAAMQRIASLRALTAVQAEKMGLDTEGFESALSDDLEFVTVALTDPEFQSLVRAATPTAQRSLLSRIWESLRSLFGYDSTNKKLADAFDELLDFTQMFAGANTFNIKSERNLRLEAHKIKDGLSALREFASVKGRLRSSAEVLFTDDSNFLDDFPMFDDEYIELAKSKIPDRDGWLASNGDFYENSQAGVMLASSTMGGHEAEAVNILAKQHPEKVAEILKGRRNKDIATLSSEEIYKAMAELGYLRVVGESGYTIYVTGPITRRQSIALRDMSIETGTEVVHDRGSSLMARTLYSPNDYSASVAIMRKQGIVLIDSEQELNKYLPNGFSIVEDPNLRNMIMVSRSNPNILYYNRELLDDAVADLSESAAKARIRGLANHEVAHTAIYRAFTQDHIARVATELGEDQLQKIAEQYYSTAGLTAEETLANIKADRESGVLSDERLADEWIRMQVEKAVVGQTYEDVIKGTKGNQTLISTIVDAIKAFVTRLRQRFADYPSTETAAAISHASRTLRKINQSGSIDFNADLYESNRFGDTANFFSSLDGSPVGDQVSYSIPVLSSNAGKVDALNARLKLYNLPSQLRDVLNLRSGTINQIAASSKALVKYFPKYRDLALKGGVSMDEIKLLFGTTAPPLTDSDLKEIADKVLIFEATIPVTETEGRKADLVAEYSEKLKRERRLRFNDAFVKLQQAAEQSITDAGFGQLVNEAVAFRKDINKFKGLTGFDESDDVYLTRAYKFFNTEGWSLAAKSGGVIKIEGKDVDFGKLRDAAAAAYYEEAEAEFQKIGKPYTDKDVTDLTLKKLDNYLSTLETMTSAVDARVVESIRKDLNRFKPKKDIDSTFRELLGEIDDPLANAVNTLYRVGMLSANEKFRTDFAKTAIDLGLASKDPKAGWITSFAASSAPRTGDLAGLYFEPKVAGVLSEVIGANMKGLNAHSTNLMNGLGRAAMGVSGVAIQMKTQFGVGYWPRNAIGGYVLSAAQGIFMNPFSAKGRQARTESWRASFASLPTEQAQRESILRLIELNVLNDQSQGRVAQDLLRGLIASPEQELQELMSALDEARATKDAGGVFARIQQNGYLKGGLDKALSGYSQITDKLAALDGAIDGMFKANAYYHELDVIKKHFGTSLSTEQQEEAAARKVKLTFAGNSQVIDIVKSFNKTPMAALFLPFARWKSEVFRTMLNTIPLAMEEIGQGGVMARRGTQRLTSFIATLVAAPAVLGTLATTVFRALTGDDEEEERKLTAVELAALRESLPQWQRGHQLNAQILKGGRVQFIDMDFILPHSQLTNLVSIITEGIQTGDGVNASRLASYVTGDLIGTQIAATAIDEILNNADDRGQPIYLETDNAAQKMQRMLGHYAKGALIPSSLVKGSELLREGQTNREEIFWGEILGSRPKTVTFGDVERRGFRNLKGLLDNSVSIIGGLTSGRFKSDSEIDDVVDRHQDALNETQRRLNRFMRSMVSMGSTESSVYSSAKIYRFSDDTISSAYQGYRIAWRPNDKWNQKTYFNAEQAKEQDPTQKIQSVNRSVNRKAAVNYISDASDE